MHVSVLGESPAAVTVHWEDDCLAYVVLDLESRVAGGAGRLEDAEAEAARRGAGWTATPVCVDDLTDDERVAAGGCAGCHLGPCEVALMPGEFCSHGCGCRGRGE